MTGWQGGFRNPFVASSTQLADGVVTSVKLASTIQSDNFVSGTSGWQIRRDTGSAEFNNITIRGDLISANWDGSDPLDLPDGSTIDQPSQGFALDSSKGWASFAGGVEVGDVLRSFVFQTFSPYAGWVLDGATGDVTIGGDLTIGGAITLDGDGQVLRIDNGLGGDLAFMGYSPTGYGATEMVFSNEGNLGPIVISAGGFIELRADGSGSDTVVVRGTGTGVPATVFSVQNKAGTSEYFRIDDTPQVQVPLGSASSPGLTFLGDLNTGIYRPAANQVGIVGGGSQLATFKKITDGVEWVLPGVAGVSILGTRVGTVDTLFLQTNDNIIMQHSDGTELARFNKTDPRFSLSGDTNTGFSTPVGDQLSLYAGGTQRGLWGNSGLHIYGRNGDFFINDDFADVGNHETLRADRLGGGSPIFSTQVGYFSSWRKTKTDIKPLGNSPYWDRKWFMDIATISARKKKTTKYFRDLGYDMRFFSFLMDNLIKHTNLLTTKGEKVGEEPDLQAILAVTVDFVQEQQRQINKLQQRLDKMEQIASMGVAA